MTIAFLNADSLRDISAELLLPNGRLKLLPAADYKNYSWDEFRLFCHTYARYGIPTAELIDHLKELIGDRSAIEIGAGAGDLGYHLGIKMTDSKQQERPDVAAYYKAMGQPPIRYPDDVEKIDALEAVKKYKPKVVVASWITPYAPHPTSYGSNFLGVKEDEILKLVDTFAIIGNLDIHRDKPIRKISHANIHAPWILSRAKNPNNNCIFMWNK